VTAENVNERAQQRLARTTSPTAAMGSSDPRTDSITSTPPGAHGFRARLGQVARLAQEVGEADATQIEATARELGESRRYLAPIAWAAGALVLAVHGVKLLVLNWRLSLIELVPALWVWVVMWDLKDHTLRGAQFRQLTPGGALLLGLLAVSATVGAFWCNTVFGFAIEQGQPRIRPAARQANRHLGMILGAGIVMGVLLAGAAIVVPRIGPGWLFVLVLGAVLGLMLISFVAIPARIIGARRQKLPLREAAGRMAAGGALSAVAMTPGFLLDRIGLILLAAGAHIIGLFLLAIGSALYAAGMSSVRAVKLTMKLGTSIGT
jgi:hypothetical protein